MRALVFVRKFSECEDNQKEGWKSSFCIFTCTLECFINDTLQQKKDAIPVRTPHGCI